MSRIVKILLALWFLYVGMVLLTSCTTQTPKRIGLIDFKMHEKILDYKNGTLLASRAEYDSPVNKCVVKKTPEDGLMNHQCYVFFDHEYQAILNYITVLEIKVDGCSR